MNMYLRGALIAGGVVVGGVVAYSIFQWATTPALGSSETLPVPGAPLESSRTGESTGTAIGRVLETAITQGTSALNTRNTLVAQSNAQIAAQNARNAGGASNGRTGQLTAGQRAAQEAKLR